MSELDMGTADAAIARASDVTRRPVGARRAAAGDDAGGPVRLGTTELAQVKLDARPAGAPVVAYLGPGAAPSSGEAVALRPTTDRAPHAWRILGRAPVAVRSQSVLGVNGYVYGPYSLQEEWFIGGTGGSYANAFPSPAPPAVGSFVCGVTVVAGDRYAWLRVTAQVSVAHHPRPGFPSDLPINANCVYRVTNSDWPTGTGPLLPAGSALSASGGIGFDPPLDKDDINGGTWYRTDGIGNNTPNAAWVPGGSLIISVFYQVQHFGDYDIRVLAQGSIRRGSIAGGVGPTRANRFVSIPGYPP